jgi:hypothetical protein
MYLAALRLMNTRQLYIYRGNDRRRFKRWHRRRIAAGENLEILEKGVSEERIDALMRRDNSINYRVIPEVMYGGQTFDYRRRDHTRDSAAARKIEDRIFVEE